MLHDSFGWNKSRSSIWGQAWLSPMFDHGKQGARQRKSQGGDNQTRQRALSCHGNQGVVERTAPENKLSCSAADPK